MTALRESFGDKPVIDFKTVDWQRATADQMTVFIPSTIRGRLVDTKNGQILWEEACTVSQDRVAANLTEVRDTLEASAERCGEQFAERFSRPRQTN